MKVEELLNNIHCTGCFACLNVCPVNAIAVSKDTNGFLMPIIDNNRCVNCKNCIKHCPQRIDFLSNKPMRSFVGFCNDELIYKSSASGGAFAAIAHAFIKNGGIVFGAAYSSINCEVKHIMVDDPNLILRLQGSKYVQSNVGNIYRDVATLLKSNKRVLFSGTPCQIAGLYSSLNDSLKSNLFTVEVICHGVSNDTMLKKSIMSYRKNCFPDEIRFRNKSKYEKSDFSLKITYPDGKKKIIDARKDLYYRMYVDGLIYRESCYHCLYATNNRKADITLGDCSTYKDYRKLSKIKALSTIIINTKKGEFLWKMVETRMSFCLQDMKKEMAANSQLSHPSFKPNNLETIYNDFKKMSVNDLKAKYVKSDFKYNVRRLLKRIIPLKIRALFFKAK